MDEKMKTFIDEAIKVEKNMANLYRFYEEHYLDDAEFWHQLSKEEVEHATILELGSVFESILPEEMMDGRLDTMKSANKLVEDTIKKYAGKLPPKKEAYNFAYECEQSAGELHYQEIASGEAETEATKKFQKLNADDKDHAERIKAFIDEGIKEGRI